MNVCVCVYMYVCMYVFIAGWQRKLLCCIISKVFAKNSISCNKSNEWDTKSISDAYGFFKRIANPPFLIAFQTVHYFFVFTRGLSEKLLGSSLHIVERYNINAHKKSLLSSLRKKFEIRFELVFKRAEEMAKIVEVKFKFPRTCKKQTQGPNTVTDTLFNRDICPIIFSNI